MAASGPVVDAVQFVLGTAVVWAPGLLLVRALAAELDWAKTLAASVVVSLTVPPATLYALNLFMGVPVTPTNAILVFLTWASVGAALWAGPRLDRALAA